MVESSYRLIGLLPIKKIRYTFLDETNLKEVVSFLQIDFFF